MTEVAINKSNEVFYAGDIVTYQSYGTQYGAKVLQMVFIDTIQVYWFVVQFGKIVDNAWKGDVGYDGEPSLSVLSAKELRGSYSNKWTPGLTVKSGDVLKDQNGEVFLVETDQKVWNLKDGTKASLDNWEKAYSRKFKVHTTAGGSKFSNMFTTK